MSKQKIIIPTVKFDTNGFNQILKVISIITSNPKKSFDFDFSKCSRLDHHGVVLLGGISRYVNFQNSKLARTLIRAFNGEPFATAGVMFDVNSMSELIRKNLIENNFLSHFTQSGFSGYAQGDYIGYREHTTKLDEDNIAEHLNDQWLSDDKVKLSGALKPEIVSRIFEIFMNAYGHGTSIQALSQLGVYSCGQYDRKENTLSLSVLDFGPGIVNNVMEYNQDIETPSDALEWALTRGNSTETDSIKKGMARGLGFDLLSDFVKLNNGEIRVYSNKVSAKIIDGSDFTISESEYDLPGTLVSIKINCDNKYYHFKSENTQQTKYF
ncbi:MULTISPECIES: hypothetical protein [Pseudoalteromonas]|uniref:hypothetical protein n=2 Tax=Pseudoalteromonas TaxID=53246 RepID=UPI000C3CFBBB|nr:MULTISPECIES: hypothetical protein [Pseudoalteromonas]MAY57697.1 hypothetical protein [Pseudoalteromonas sp.]MDN3409110.1 hypothetical protein [Pseudoalteromonas sp. APC 3894]MDN3416494.1 hypothetical protein [Pseudoalteromonas sp. APC 3227]MDN3420191.1 hypothetical protein [Pseudoalteromonas sp. APC 3895]MDN3423786.1 hypothetical protein [Pseudoalteromonas sp. APC 3896]